MGEGVIQADLPQKLGRTHLRSVAADLAGFGKKWLPVRQPRASKPSGWKNRFQ